MDKNDESPRKTAHPGTAERGVELEERGFQASDSLRTYFNSIRKYPLLTAGEEKTLARRIARGDGVARRTMIESNLRLVVNIAKRYINRGFALQDLVEEGNIGLIKSVERFKANKGCKFSTYATYWIKQSIERAIANQSNVVRLPIHITSDISKVTRAARDLLVSLKREPTMEEISERTGFSGRYVKKLDGICRKCYSLDAGPQYGGEQPLLDMIEDTAYPGPVELLDEARRAEMIARWLAALDENERSVIRLRFGLDGDGTRTLESIGRVFGVTRERVRQIEVKALGRLKEIIKETAGLTPSDV
jgi:RNA polymerase primary sigma factor